MERKFWYDFDIEKKLIELGARKVEKSFGKVIIDDYFDNFESYFLLLNDYLLRSRSKNNKSNWQLKYPSKLADLNKNVENYFEISDSKEIINSIIDLSKSKNVIFKHENECNTIETLVDMLGLKPYARINSTRKSYIIENIRVDLDETDFNYRLGELEVVLDESLRLSENIEKSIQKISILTSKLGITNIDGIPGKISTYLYLFNPKLFEILRKNLIIDDKVILNLKKFYKNSC